MPKPRRYGVCGDLKSQGAFAKSIAQISANSLANCKVSDSNHQEVCEKLFSLVSGWEAIFLRQIVSQAKLSAPQKRKLQAICDRHFPAGEGGAE